MLPDDTSTPILESGLPGWRFAVSAGILGWVLDAFDFFVLVFLLNELMARYHCSKAAIVWSITLTLAMRPLGALLFGTLADRFGRKLPLIGCVLYFTTVSVLTGLAPTYTLFLATRILYGLGMGGYWGIGASFALESAPRRRRGLLSGVMQSGYPAGYLLASIAIQVVPPRYGWHAMFYCGVPLALLIVVLTVFAPESAVWQHNRVPSLRRIFATLWQHRAAFVYLLLLMMGMNALSHGTQDLYPDFLKSLPWMAHAMLLGVAAGHAIPVLYNISAIVAAFIVGALSERIGRRYAMIAALVLCMVAMPMWAFGGSLAAIVVGSCVMQAGVQGAFGVIPAHLNELSPDAIRGLFPGFVYQLGVLFASPTPPLENLLQAHLGYPWALCSFESIIIVLLLGLFVFGPEQRGRSFLAPPQPTTQPTT